MFEALLKGPQALTYRIKKVRIVTSSTPTGVPDDVTTTYLDAAGSLIVGLTFEESSRVGFTNTVSAVFIFGFPQPLGINVSIEIMYPKATRVLTARFFKDLVVVNNAQYNCFLDISNGDTFIKSIPIRITSFNESSTSRELKAMASVTCVMLGGLPWSPRTI